jgi:two-component system chemotaxis sensor kinase CheA
VSGQGEPTPAADGGGPAGSRVTGQEDRFRRLFVQEAEDRLGRLSELVLELEAAGEDADRELVGSVFREAHTLKGAAANFGAEAVVESARRLEEMGRGGSLAAAAEACEDLERRLAELLGQIETRRRAKFEAARVEIA